MNGGVVELYRRAVEAVCAECGVCECGLLGSNMEECADARYVLVKVLAVFLTDTELSELMGKSRQCVNGIRNDGRTMRWSVRRCYEAVRDAVGDSARFPQ